MGHLCPPMRWHNFTNLFGKTLAWKREFRTFRVMSFLMNFLSRKNWDYGPSPLWRGCNTSVFAHLFIVFISLYKAARSIYLFVFYLTFCILHILEKRRVYIFFKQWQLLSHTHTHFDCCLWLCACVIMAMASWFNARSCFGRHGGDGGASFSSWSWM